MLIHPSLVQIPEAQLVERLTAVPHWRSYLLGIKGIASNVVPFRSVPFTGLPGEPQGDVDLLLNVLGRPDLATAVEAKRIKVGAAALRDRRPNKLHGFREGIRQANLLAKIGFSQVYLFVFVVVDSREQNGGRITYDGLPPDLTSMISGFISPLGLDQRIGLIHYELVQPMDDEPLGTGMYGGHLIRLAEPLVQPKEVTAWVARVTSAGAPYNDLQPSARCAHAAEADGIRLPMRNSCRMKRETRHEAWSDSLGIIGGVMFHSLACYRDSSGRLADTPGSRTA